MDNKAVIKRLTTTLASGILFTMAGCQSTAQEPREVQEINLQQKEVNAFATYEQSKVQYETWLVTLKESSSLKIYSADLYSELLNAWDETVEVYQAIAVDPAKAVESYSLFSSATYAQVFTDRLFEVQKKFTAIMKLKEQADLILSDSVAQMAYLQGIDAAVLYPNDYRTIYSNYSELFEYVYDGDLDDAQTEQVTFLKKAKALEVKIVLAKFIVPLQTKLKEFQNEGFNHFAAISYAKAQTEISSAENIVKMNARDLKNIKQSVIEAEFELAHVRNTVNEVKLLSSVKNEKFEPMVLAFEGQLLAVSKALNNSDYRDQPIRVQSKLIVEAVNKLQNDKATEELQKQLALLGNTADALQSVNSEQAKLLIEEQNKNSSLIKQLQRSDFQIASLETLLSSYKKQLETKLLDNVSGNELPEVGAKSELAPKSDSLPETQAVPIVAAEPVVAAEPAVEAAPVVVAEPVVAKPVVEAAPVVTAESVVTNSDSALVVTAESVVTNSDSAPVVTAEPVVTKPVAETVPAI